MQLYIGNKNYSSWSLRSWLLMKQTGIEFEEINLRLDFADGSLFRDTLARVSPSSKVPVLVDDGFAVWDTLAIAEYLADKFEAKALWPLDRLERARARSLCAEMHAGFSALRQHFPMNIEASLPDVGVRMLSEVPAAAADLRRIDEMWTIELDKHSEPFLFGEFTIADAYFAPVCSRIETYGLPVTKTVLRYVTTMLSLPAMQVWAAAARDEHDFLPFDEPYRTSA